MRPLISLTTDFGNSHYVGQLKAVLLSLLPAASIVDITHEIGAQNIVAGAIVLADSIPYFPAESIHIAVVDPGVGSNRPIIAARVGHWFVIGPDNGLWSSLAEEYPVGKIVELNRSEHWRPDCSRTFHGRDIMAPIAAKIADGIDLLELGDARPQLHASLVRVPICIPGRAEGKVIFADSFGNLVTNLRRDHLPDLSHFTPQISLVNHSRTPRWVGTYSEGVPGECVALFGSSGRVEIAMVNGAASKVFCSASTLIEVTW